MQLLVNIDVDDVERAVGFYTSALDLNLSRLLFDGTVAELTGASATIYLLAKPSGSRPVPQNGSLRDYRRHWTPVHLDFLVDDIDAAVARAVAAGAALESGVSTYRWGELATFADPFGHGFCLIQFSDAGYGDEGT
jgi:predicted enzyme related to lactoylglutathione lyase